MADEEDVSHKRRKLGAVSREEVFGETPRVQAPEVETDAHRIAQRRKQIEYGKNTLIYTRFKSEVRKRSGRHPRTPDIFEKVSKRAFDCKVKAWRRALHSWDAENPDRGTFKHIVKCSDPVEDDAGFNALFEDALESAQPADVLCAADTDTDRERRKEQGSISGEQFNGSRAASIASSCGSSVCDAPDPKGQSFTLSKASSNRVDTHTSLRDRLNAHKAQKVPGSPECATTFKTPQDDKQVG